MNNRVIQDVCFLLPLTEKKKIPTTVLKDSPVLRGSYFPGFFPPLNYISCAE